ncbi:hypothetical protein EYZ11_013279 [Aspergillus tanneri]|nr:hypothetical protein EYZ11_013279 [Aspergillus tanneri]
MLLLSKH